MTGIQMFLLGWAIALVIWWLALRSRRSGAPDPSTWVGIGNTDHCGMQAKAYEAAGTRLHIRVKIAQAVPCNAYPDAHNNPDCGVYIHRDDWCLYERREFTNAMHQEYTRIAAEQRTQLAEMRTIRLAEIAASKDRPEA